MTRKPNGCLEIEPDLVAAATGDAEPGASRRVEHHIDSCGACRREFHRYREIEGVVGVLRRGPAAADSVARAREGLESRLADLRSRLVSYRVFPSPLGHILIARSEHGVSLVEYLHVGTDLSMSRLSRVGGVEAQEDGAEIEALYRELLEYLRGDRTRLEWPLDLRLARSDFHRAVLRATAAIGAVALIASCTAQVTHAARKPAISPANGGIPPNITITPGSQIPPVSMPRMQPGLPAAIRLVTSDKHRFLALPSGRIEPVGQHHGSGRMLPPTGAY